MVIVFKFPKVNFSVYSYVTENNLKEKKRKMNRFSHPDKTTLKSTSTEITR